MQIEAGCCRSAASISTCKTKEITQMSQNNNSEHLLETKVENPDVTTPADANVTHAITENIPAEHTSNPKRKRPLSEARLRANRENAKKSTGPRTPEGKQRSSLNGTRHGILAQVIVLPKEDMDAYNE